MIRLMSYTHIDFYYELHKVVDEMRQAPTYPFHGHGGQVNSK